MMSLLDTVKSLLGLEDTGEPRRQGDVSVTVEHEPTSDTAPATAAEDAVKGTDATSTAAPDDGAVQATATDDSPTDDGEPLDVIKGVGSTYADRLEDAGIETVDQLADADPEALAEKTGISEKRLTRWIERAKHR